MSDRNSPNCTTLLRLFKYIIRLTTQRKTDRPDVENETHMGDNSLKYMSFSSLSPNIEEITFPVERSQN